MGNCSFMSNPVIIGQSCLGGAIERRHMAAVRGFELKTVCAFFLPVAEDHIRRNEKNLNESYHTTFSHTIPLWKRT